MYSDTTADVEEFINSSLIVLFIKGRKCGYICGLSENINYLMKKQKLKYKSVNLMDFPNLNLFLHRHHREYSSPYLYIEGKFIGGYEKIVTMFDTNEITQIIEKYGEDAYSTFL